MQKAQCGLSLLEHSYGAAAAVRRRSPCVCLCLPRPPARRLVHAASPLLARPIGRSSSSSLRYQSPGGPRRLAPLSLRRHKSTRAPDNYESWWDDAGEGGGKDAAADADDVSATRAPERPQQTQQQQPQQQGGSEWPQLRRSTGSVGRGGVGVGGGARAGAAGGDGGRGFMLNGMWFDSGSQQRPEKKNNGRTGNGNGNWDSQYNARSDQDGGSRNWNGYGQHNSRGGRPYQNMQPTGFGRGRRVGNEGRRSGGGGEILQDWDAELAGTLDEAEVAEVAAAFAEEPEEELYRRKKERGSKPARIRQPRHAVGGGAGVVGGRRSGMAHQLDEYDDYDDDDGGGSGARDYFAVEEDPRERKRERERRKEERRRAKDEAEAEARARPRQLRIPPLISVGNLASALAVGPDALVRQLAELGFDDTTAQSIMAGDDAALIALEYGFEPVVEKVDGLDSGRGGAGSAEGRGSDDNDTSNNNNQQIYAAPPPTPEVRATLPPRPPVVTIMGHVDHGKTTLLDYLRKSSVAASEHGGITQHIGAFSVDLSAATFGSGVEGEEEAGGGSSTEAAPAEGQLASQTITFLDTPGHAAFLAMRRRGALATDIAVVVVAADDGVKPQTVEALRHVAEAGVPLIVAVTKIDKEVGGLVGAGGRVGGGGGQTALDARIDAIAADLAAHHVVAEAMGGDVQMCPVSARTGAGMRDLADAIAALAEVLDLRAEAASPYTTTTTDRRTSHDVENSATAAVPCEGFVLESTTSPHTGRAATVLLKRGRLARGSTIVAGRAWCRVRLLRDPGGNPVSALLPGHAAEVLGWRDDDGAPPPQAGDAVLEAPDEGVARETVRRRAEWVDRERDAREVANTAAQARMRKEVRDVAMAAQKEAARRRRESGVWTGGMGSWRVGGHSVGSAWEGGGGGGGGAEATGDANNAKSGDAPTTGPLRVPFVVRADVAGSVEAVCAALGEIGSGEVATRVLRSGAGALAESDVEHARVTGSLVVVFNAAVPPAVRRLAAEEGVVLLEHAVIYHLVDDVKAKLADRLPPRVTERVLGEADVLQVFPINVRKKLVVNIAGCRVRNGVISKPDRVKVLRGGEVVYDGKIETFKQLKKDITEIRKGSECGLGIEGFESFEPGDQIQAYEQVSEKRHL